MGERRQLDLKLQFAVSISGSVLALDNSPQALVVVQVVEAALGSAGDSTNVSASNQPPRSSRRKEALNSIPDAEPRPPDSNQSLLTSAATIQRQGGVPPGLPSVRVVATTLTDESGAFKFINLRPGGTYQVRIHTPGKLVYYKDEQSMPFDGRPLSGIDFRLPPIKKGAWKNFTYADGSAADNVHAAHIDPEGNLWFGTDNGGVSRFDGGEFVNFTRAEGLDHNSVRAIHQDPDGTMLFATEARISRWTGNGFVPSNLPGKINNILSIERASDGTLWVGTGRPGVWRYDGKDAVNLRAKDDLVHDVVLCLHQGSDGTIWFGTYSGVSRYDGTNLVTFAAHPALMGVAVEGISEDTKGVMWFGTASKGVFRYDGTNCQNLTTADGLVSDVVRSIHCDPDGVVWIGG